MTIRVQFFFVQGRQGWSEVHYLSPDLFPNLDTEGVTKEVENLRDARLGLLGRGARMTYIRASDIDVFRDALVYPLSGNASVNPDFRTSGGGGSFGSEDDADAPWTTLLCRGQSGTKYWRFAWMGGLYDFQTQLDAGGDLVWVPSATQLDRFGAFKTILTNRKWGFPVNSRDVNAPEFEVNRFTKVGNVRINNSQNGLANGKKIILRRPRGSKFPHGTFSVTNIDALGFELLGTQGFDPAILEEYKGGSFFREKITVFKLYTEFFSVRLTSHDRGLPFGLRRGRRPCRSA